MERINLNSQPDKYDSYKGSVDVITAMGHIIDFDNPFTTKIDLEDIRIHISNIRRFNGAVDVTLIHHLALATKLAEILPMSPFTGQNIYSPRLVKLFATLFQSRSVQKAYSSTHDFPEVYVGDIVTNLKRRLTSFQSLEDDFDALIHDVINLPRLYRNDSFVKLVDHTCLVLEMDHTNHPAAQRTARKLGIEINQGLRNLSWSILTLNPKIDTHNKKLWTIISDSIDDGVRELARIKEDNGYN